MREKGRVVKEEDKREKRRKKAKKTSPRETRENIAEMSGLYRNEKLGEGKRNSCNAEVYRKGLGENREEP